MNKTALVTRATGFIGSYSVGFLRSKAWKVIGSYRSRHSDSLPRLPNLHFVQCDLRNRRQVEQLLKKHDPTHVFHLAAQSLPTVSWADPVTTFESNVMGSLHLFEAVRQLKRPPLVMLACSGAEYGHVQATAIPVVEEHPLRPVHPYGLTKMCVDLLAREYFLDYKIPTVNLRLFNTTGPGKTNDAPSDFVRQLIRVKKGLQPRVIEVGNLKPCRAFLHVSDTVRGFCLAAMKGKRGEAYNLCGSEPHSMRQVLQTAIHLSGLKVKIRSATHLMRPSDEKIIFGSTAKFRKHTGWKPTLSLEQT
jgi:GDP-4-dehydro-6-deoxy-D-mannose reductase